MTDDRDGGLVSPSDIADLAEVSRGAVSNWRKRDQSFPEPVSGTPSKPLFSLDAVTRWLEKHGRLAEGSSLRTNSGSGSAMAIWSALNSIRGDVAPDDAIELVLALAIARKDVGGIPDTPSGVDARALNRLKAAVDQIDIPDLAAAVDFTLERFARSQGRSGGDLGFVGSRTSTVLANLAAARPGGVLYDPACGIATALLEAVRRGAAPRRTVGHDVDKSALRVASIRAALLDVDLELAQTDVLAEDIDPALRADVIIVEPPFGMRFDARERLLDARFSFGTPPQTSADTAWMQHAVAHLTDGGHAYVITPRGVLFRSGEEGRIRAELIRRGCVEAVVGLPGKLLPQTSIPLALWVLRQETPTPAVESVLFIDASTVDTPEDGIADWLRDAAARSKVPHAEVDITEILASESVLTPERWVHADAPDPNAIADAYFRGWAAIGDAIDELHRRSTPLADADYSHSRVATVGELIEQGVIQLRPGRPKDRYQNLPPALDGRIVTASDVRDGTLRGIGVEVEPNEFPDLTSEGDVLMTTMNETRTRVDEVGGHLPSTGVYRIRVVDQGVLLPGYVAHALRGSWNNRFQTGATIQRANAKDLEIPLVPVAQQREIQAALDSLRLLQERASKLEKDGDGVATSLLDAVRYNALLVDRSGSPETAAGRPQPNAEELK